MVVISVGFVEVDVVFNIWGIYNYFCIVMVLVVMCVGEDVGSVVGCVFGLVM